MRIVDSLQTDSDDIMPAFLLAQSPLIDNYGDVSQIGNNASSLPLPHPAESAATYDEILPWILLGAVVGV
jgi:hypothetical protein